MRKQMITTLVGLITIFGFAAPLVASAASCTVTVNSGSSIQSAINSAASNAVVCVHSGTYHEKLTLSRSGTASSPFTLQAYPGETPVIDGQNNLPTGGMYDILVALTGNYIIFDGFEVKNSAGQGVVITGSNDTVQNSNIHHSYDNGLRSEGNNNTLQNNNIWENVQANLNARCSPDGNPCWWGTALSVANQNSGGSAQNNIVRGNISHDNWGEGIDSFEASGTLIENNISYNNFSVNLYLSDTQNVTARNNLVYQINGTHNRPGTPTSGITIADENSSKPRSNNVQVTNNIVYGANVCEMCWTSVSGATGINVNHTTIVNGSFSRGSSGTSESANCSISASQVPGLGTVTAGSLTAQRFSTAQCPSGTGADVSQFPGGGGGGDTTPPTAPSNLTTSAVSSSQINLSWGASIDNVGVTGYRVERCQGSGCSNFSQIATPSGTSYSNTGLAASTAYSYRVRATDAAGNLSGYSNTASATTQASTPTSITVRRATVTHTTDGSLAESDWNLQTSAAKCVMGTCGNTTTFDANWDDTYLYVAAKVLDANLYNDSTNVWDDDGVEVFVDPNNSHSTTYDATDIQLIKGYNDTTLWSSRTTTGVLHASAPTTGGYIVEVAIPWSQLGVTPSAGMTIGLDIGNDGDDNGSTRDAQAVWAGTAENWGNTSAFGQATLAASTNPAPTVTISANPTSVASGGSSTLTWSSTNATSCTASGGWSGSKATSGTQTLTGLTSTATYTLTCTGAGGSANATVTVTVSATSFFTVTSPANGATVSGTISVVGTAGTQWVNVAAYDANSNKIAADVTPVNGTYTLSLDTTQLPNGTNSVQVVAFSVPAGQPGGTSATVTLSLNVSNGTSIPTVIISATPQTIGSGDSSTLSWTSTDATSCTGTNFSTGGTTSGTVVVSPSATTVYTVSCTGAGGTGTNTITVTVGALSALPTISFPSGTFTWTTTNAVSCTASGGWSGSVATNGSYSFNTPSSATYVLTCTGGGTTVQRTITISTSETATVSSKFQSGQTVTTASTINVRSAPSTSATLLGTQSTGAQGTVIGGPVQANGYWWWQVDYASGPDGWSVENWLQ